MDATSPPAPPRPSLTESLEQLFRRHDRWFRPLMRRRHGHEAGEDLVHESYLRAAGYDVAEALRYPEAMLVRIAENLAIDRQRRGRFEIAQDIDSPALEKQSMSPSQEEAITFKQIVLALPDELRDVFLQNHVEGKTYDEIAKDLGIPWTTVHHRMRMALKRTSKALRE